MGKELEKIVSVIRQTSMDGFKNLAGTNIGSNHKTKDDIVHSVCTYAQDQMNIQNRLHQALESVMDGYTLDQWLEGALERATKENQAQMDKDKSIKELQWIMELLVTI